MSHWTTTPVTTPFQATLSPPGSKSLTNRALILAALANGASTLTNVLFAEDTHVMIQALQQLGFDLQIDHPNNTIQLLGQAGKIPAHSATIHCQNSGTTIRFLTALCSLGHGIYTLDGIERMRNRPMAQLLSLLKNLGVRAAGTLQPNFPPLQIHANGLAGGLAHFPTAASSQFLSAVLHVLPYARHETQISLDWPQTSWPYVEMTMRLMDHFGITPELRRNPRTGNPQEITIPRGTYLPTTYHAEPDASNATYFMAAAAIHPNASITIQGLNKSSLQGDVHFAGVLQQMGAIITHGKNFIQVQGTPNLKPIHVDLSQMPDTAQTLAAISLFAQGTTTITGLKTLKVKETDRLHALKTELTKLGAHVESTDESLTITPPVNPPANPPQIQIQTYNDHRMAMAFSITATRIPNIIIQDKECTNKTYPNFFQDLEKALHSNN